MRQVLILITLCLLAGCETMKIVTATKLQPTAPNTDVGVLQIIKDASKQAPLWNAQEVDQGVVAACSAPKPGQAEIAGASAAIWVPIVARVVMDAAGAAASRYVKKVKAQSSKSLSFKTVIKSSDLAKARCLIAYRGPAIAMSKDRSSVHEGAVPKPSALVVMKVERESDSMRLVPIYAMVQNSISLTKCTAQCSIVGREKGKINMAVAITGTAVLKPSGNDIRLRDIGTATLTVKDIPLRGKVVADAPSGGTGAPVGDRSAILAVPGNGVAVQLSVGMTEVGDIAGDPDVATGEILAATAALSEGALAEIKAHYAREAEE